ncbi:siderophore-interacting protein [Asanoa sp. NPDC049573]|uniref:siderophore-interacting protein n=1 Tax=Asanoa sp. NPDC049573 TaxID=3155396 RepID=UPI0034271061
MPDRHDSAVRGLAEACRIGDVAALRTALHADAVAVCDGGGSVPAVLGAIHGAADVADLVAGVLCGQPGTELTVEAVNGRAGLALRRGGRAIAVIAVRAAGARVATVWIVLNPAKLTGWHRR